MGRHKISDPNKDHKVIKQGLPGIIRERYRDILIPLITMMSIEATKIACLASLLFLKMVSIKIQFSKRTVMLIHELIRLFVCLLYR